jgi:hypothetical protein
LNAGNVIAGKREFLDYHRNIVLLEAHTRNKREPNYSDQLAT